MTTFETRERGWRESQSRLPGGLDAALDSKALAGLVLEAVRLVDDGELNPPVSTAATPAFRPRAMLAMLTYCYAIGVYGSHDVEGMMYEDAEFRALCGMEYPDWRRLKRFRRNNHAVLRRTIEETFRGVWRLHDGARRSACGNGVGANGHSSNGLPEPARPESFSAEAQACIERAMFIDQMAVE